MIKPDGVERGLTGKIIDRLEQKGLTVIAIKKLTPTLDLVKQHYAVHQDKEWFMQNCEFVSSGPVVPMIVEGPGVIALTRKLIGATSPFVAEPGTIRGDFSFDGQKNIMHGADSPETAEIEIRLWFPELVQN